MHIPLKKIASALIIAFYLCSAATAIAAAPLSQTLSGKILLAVEDKGKTYYVNTDGKRYRVTRVTAFEIFKKLALGISNKDLALITEGNLGIDPETGLAVSASNQATSPSPLAKQLSGKILLAVEDRGKTYYVHSDGRRYRVTQNTAFEIFKKLALGISNKDLATITEAGLGIDPETGASTSALPAPAPASPTTETQYAVTSVADGDTFSVSMNGKTERVRMIGIDTPETVESGTPVECYGPEASARTKALLSGQNVRLEADSSQEDRDRFDRLLRYAFVGTTNINLSLVQDGYARELTYDGAYKYQSEFKAAQSQAQITKKGMWADDACASPTPEPSSDTGTPSSASCVIKGNISSSSEKIFHVPGCGSYGATIIDESKGERWFCSEDEAKAAGWRKALNCP